MKKVTVSESTLRTKLLYQSQSIKFSQWIRVIMKSFYQCEYEKVTTIKFLSSTLNMKNKSYFTTIYMRK